MTDSLAVPLRILLITHNRSAEAKLSASLKHKGFAHYEVISHDVVSIPLQHNLKQQYDLGVLWIKNKSNFNIFCEDYNLNLLNLDYEGFIKSLTINNKQ